MSSKETTGNAEVKKLLQTYLQLVDTQDYGSVAIQMVGRPNIAVADFAGDLALQPGVLAAMDVAKQRIADSIDNWQAPEPDTTLDASFVCYPVTTAPLGFDFLIWLITSEMRRIRFGAPGPLKVGFWLGKVPMDTPRQVSWLNNVFRPMLPLIGAVEDNRAVLGHNCKVYLPSAIMEYADRGESLPELKSSLPPVYTDPYVTITLREATHWPHRNSDIPSWINFASYLEANGYKVIFIRDTAKAEESLGTYRTDSEAAKDLVRRMAVYEGAICNLGVANGPMGLCLFSKLPYINFCPVEDASSDYKPNTPEFWKHRQGLEVGQQWPWATKQQLTVWKKDTYQNIIEAWKLWSNAI